MNDCIKPLEVRAFPASITKRTISSLGSGTTDEEVVGFDITVYEIFLVDGLHSGDLRNDVERRLLFWIWSVSHHLPCGHADGLGGELASTHVEEVF